MSRHLGVFLGACALLTGPGLAEAQQRRAAMPSTPQPQPTWASLVGSGFLTLPDTTTLAPGRFTVALTIDNRDRDPLGLDLLDGMVAWNLGVTDRMETYGYHVFTRVVSVPDTPVLPPPPLDFVVAPGAALPPRPYYTLYSPVPYVNDRKGARFDYYVPGEALLGVKARLQDPRGKRPGLALSGEVKLPLTRDLTDLQAGSGTGGVDGTLRVTSEWRGERRSFAAATGLTFVGTPAYGDRIVVYSPDGRYAVKDEPLRLPLRWDIGLGARYALTSFVAAVAETSTVVEVGGRTRIVDRARPVDGLAGLQLRFRNVRATAALRYHGNAFHSGDRHPSPLAGLVDVTHVEKDVLNDYLSTIGAGHAVHHLRTGGQRLLALPETRPPLPPRARVIPSTYSIRSEHQVGFVLLWGFAF